MTDPAQVAARLTKAQRKALVAIDSQWLAGPGLPKRICDQLSDLRAAKMIERVFGDQSAVIHAGPDGISAKLSACWYFRLTPLGLAVKAILEQGQTDDDG